MNLTAQVIAFQRWRGGLWLTLESKFRLRVLKISRRLERRRRAHFRLSLTERFVVRRHRCMIGESGATRQVFHVTVRVVEASQLFEFNQLLTDVRPVVDRQLF